MTSTKTILFSEIEFNFKDQGVVIGQARLTGKIDKMVMFKDERKIAVVDLKTGKPLTKWYETGNTKEAQKTDRYRRQLVFYKILVENSREFNGKFNVEEGQLDFMQPEEETNGPQQRGVGLSERGEEKLLSRVKSHAEFYNGVARRFHKR